MGVVDSIDLLASVAPLASADLLGGLEFKVVLTVADMDDSRALIEGVSGFWNESEVRPSLVTV
jgi:hypothetical protein